MTISEKLNSLGNTLQGSIKRFLDKEDYGSLINDKTIKIIITAKDLKLRIVEPLPLSKKKTKISTPQQIEQMKAVKKMFKNNLDIMNIAVLLVRLDDELNRASLKSLEDDKRDMIVDRVSSVVDKLHKLLK